MSRKILSALIFLAFVMTGTGVFAQDPAGADQKGAPGTAPRTFKLLRDDEVRARDLDLADEAVEVWTPALPVGDVEVSLGVGFMGLSTTLLQHDQMIYKYNTESTFWGDVELVGESSFAPTIRIGYSPRAWFAFEGWSGVSISQYTSTITNRHSRKNEFDAETRSLITLQAGLNAVVYPLSINGDASGRWHPYLTAGVGNMWYNMNSNFVKGTNSAIDLNVGGGLRLLSDRNISLRLEVVLHRNELEWTPAAEFKQLNEGTTRVPLNEYPTAVDGSISARPIEAFAPNTMNLLQWTLGVQGAF
jgi:hypothetical protein